jgi:hypothetical protein
LIALIKQCSPGLASLDASEKAPQVRQALGLVVIAQKDQKSIEINPYKSRG